MNTMLLYQDPMLYLYDSWCYPFHSTPKLNDGFETVKESNTGYIFSILLPEVEKKDMSIRIEGNYCIVTAETKKPNAHFSFMRQFLIPENVNQDTIQASMKNGTLTIEMQKKKSETAKRIEISNNYQHTIEAKSLKKGFEKLKSYFNNIFK